MAAAHGNPIPLGNETTITEEALDLWRFTTIENLWRDLVYGFRGLGATRRCSQRPPLARSRHWRQHRIFSLGVEFLLSEPSVTGASSLVAVRLADNSHIRPEALDFIRQSGVFKDVVGDNNEVFVNWNDGRETHRLFAVATTKNYFATLGHSGGTGTRHPAPGPRHRRRAGPQSSGARGSTPIPRLSGARFRLKESRTRWSVS